MMTRMTAEMKRLFEQMDDNQKIRMFYELGKYIINNVDRDIVDDNSEDIDYDMKNLVEDIANVVNDIENL